MALPLRCAASLDLPSSALIQSRSSTQTRSKTSLHGNGIRQVVDLPRIRVAEPSPRSFIVFDNLAASQFTYHLTPPLPAAHRPPESRLAAHQSGRAIAAKLHSL